MRVVGAVEARKRLGTLLDQVEHGEEIIITRHGRPIARLIPVEIGFNRVKGQRAGQGLIEASRGVTLGGLRLKDLIATGRA